MFSIVGSAHNGTISGFRIYESEAIKETVNHTGCPTKHDI